MKKWMLIGLWILGILFLLVAITLATLPTIIEDYIEENDRELIGREISISDIEIVAKYRLVYNNDTKKYEKILVYNENDLEDVKNE